MLQCLIYTLSCLRYLHKVYVVGYSGRNFVIKTAKGKKILPDRKNDCIKKCFDERTKWKTNNKKTKLQEIDKTWTKKRKSFQIKLNEKENIQ